MKLRNKQTGEIAHPDRQFWEDSLKLVCEGTNKIYVVKTIAELNEEWEDATEEPKEYYWIDYDGKVKSFIDLYEWQDKMKQIGNYFETEKEAEKAVEKLKAWKRLKDKGFRFSGWEIDQKKHLGVITIKTEPYYSFEFDDLDLLFGGEE